MIDIAVDFDGTVAKHEYPDIGEEVPGAFMWLKRYQAMGARLIMNTMRSGKELLEAVEWCEERGIKFFGVNCNPEQKNWTTSPKVYAQIYVDDANACCPLVEDPAGGRDWVNWDILGPVVAERLTRCR